MNDVMMKFQLTNLTSLFSAGQFAKYGEYCENLGDDI